MGNYVYCSLQVPALLAEKTETIIEDWNQSDNYVVGIKRYDFEEVRDGENQWREDLIKAGIPFDWDSDDSDSLNEGDSSIRFTPRGYLIEYLSLHKPNWRSMALNTIAMCNTGKTQTQISRYMYKELCNEFVIKLNDPNQIDYGQRSVTLGLVLQDEVPSLNNTPRYMIPKKTRLEWLNWGIKNELHSIR